MQPRPQSIKISAILMSFPILRIVWTAVKPCFTIYSKWKHPNRKINTNLLIEITIKYEKIFLSKDDA